MNRSDLIRKVSQQTKIPQAKIEEILDALIATITTALASSEPVVIKNFGRWEIRERAPTIRRNPASGIEIKVPSRRAILFHSAKALKEGVQDAGSTSGSSGYSPDDLG